VGEAGTHVEEYGSRGGEVDDDIDALEEGRGEGCGVVVLVGGEDANGVAAGCGYFCYELAGLAGTEDEDAHEVSLVLMRRELVCGGR
jgi:hypothetical protein